MNNNISENIEKILQRLPELPIIAGNIAVNFALDNFKKQGFQGETFQPWAARKNPAKWGTAPPRNSRAILMDTGRLRRSIRVVEINGSSVTIGSDVPYAKTMNEGSEKIITQNVKAHQRKKTKFGIAKIKKLKTRSNIEFGRVDTGGRIEVKAHTRKIKQNIPPRPFLKDSPVLHQQLREGMLTYITKNLNS